MYFFLFCLCVMKIVFQVRLGYKESAIHWVGYHLVIKIIQRKSLRFITQSFMGPSCKTKFKFLRFLQSEGCVEEARSTE